jgi:cation-transporting ATPase 13A1
MSVVPYPIQCLRDGKWTSISTDQLLPNDVVSIGKENCIFVFPLSYGWFTARRQSETTIPADVLLLGGACIMNEALLSGESTPLLKESIHLLDHSEKLDVDETHKNSVLFSGTKILQAVNPGTVTSPSS